MFCETAREMMLARKPRSFEPNEAPEFERHLGGCEACRDLYQGLIHTEQLAASWEDEPVPQWDRPALASPSLSPFTSWLTWMPLAACLVMCVLVMGRVRVGVDEGGWRIEFGGTHNEQAVAKVVAKALAEERANHQLEMQRLLAEYSQTNQSRFEAVAAKMGETVRTERNEDMVRLVSGWRDQRNKDMNWVDERFQTIEYRQVQTQDNLYKVANYVSQSK